MYSNKNNKFVICVKNSSYEASLEPRKVYEMISDESASAQGLIRVLDESGEDYLFPEDYFVSIQLPQHIRDVLVGTVHS